MSVRCYEKIFFFKAATVLAQGLNVDEETCEAKSPPSPP